MTKGEKKLCVLAGIFLLVGAACYFAVPGMKFSGWLLSGLAVLCLMVGGLNRWAKKSRTGRVARWILLFGLTAGVLVFAVTERSILNAAQSHSDEQADAVIVLGAGVNGTTPSLALQSRIDAAEAYLTKYPEIPAVLSGGQGRGEDITEARAMYRALVADGVNPDRLILEERSTNTVENFRYSRELLQKQGVDITHARIAVVTNDFHVFRAGLLADREGLSTFGISAKLPWWWLSVNYDIREVFAVWKMVLLQAVT